MVRQSRSRRQGTNVTQSNAAKRRPSAVAREAGGEELAAKGRQVRPDRAAAVAGAEPTAHESPAQGRNGGAGEKLSPANPSNATRPMFYTINILKKNAYEDWHYRDVVNISQIMYLSCSRKFDSK